ncbi:MarR family winged helix-turn-helix transcriptional regulator [Herbidospora galbida]|nr:MarR family transcriptional regulator [Herbidospora galbida]
MDRVDEMITRWRAQLPEAATTELEIAKRAGRLKGMIEEVTARVLGAHGLTYADFDVLATLRREGAPYRLKPSGLSNQLMLTTGGTSNILQRLQSAGLVDREPDPTDGRSSWVRLTPKGVAMSEQLAMETTKAHRELLAPVSPERLRTLADLLRDVLTDLGDGV